LNKVTVCSHKVFGNSSPKCQVRGRHGNPSYTGWGPLWQEQSSGGEAEWRINPTPVHLNAPFPPRAKSSFPCAGLYFIHSGVNRSASPPTSTHTYTHEHWKSIAVHI